LTRHKYLAVVMFMASAALVLWPSPLRAQGQKLVLEGVVQDPNGDVLSGVQIILSNDTKIKREARSNDQGRFRFVDLPADSYLLNVSIKGFASQEQAVRLNHPPTTHNILLTLQPSINEVVTVAVGNVTIALDPQEAAGSQVLKGKDLEALPDDPDQFAEQLQLLASSSGSAPGQAVVTVSADQPGSLFRRARQGAVPRRPHRDLYEARNARFQWLGFLQL
jgi:hypothetical protein